jgi:hypothetical protein
MDKILMIYTIPKGNDSIRISFNRKLFCYRMQANSGKFDKKTKGILENYEKPIRSTIIFEKNKLTKVKELCQKFNIDSKFYEIRKISN